MPITSPPAGDTARIVLLRISPRVAPGLLSWRAWEALRAATAVYAAPGDPLRPALDDAGIAVTDAPADLDTAVAALLAAGLCPGSPEAHVLWVAADDGDPRLVRALGQRVLQLSQAGEAAPEIEILPGSYDLPGATVLDLVAVMDRLRSPGGCPWDAEQTHATLVPYLLEEAYETVETIEDGDIDTAGPDRDALREELGDVLLQVAFHSRVAQEHPDDPFTIDDVAAGIVAKLKRRHPHVFADVNAPTAEHVAANWEKLKAEEKGRKSVVEGIPLAQPALALTAKLLSRAERGHVPVELPPAEPPADADELGESLLALAAAGHRAGLDPELALRASARRLRDAIMDAEQENDA
jgi:XTP/dITP diphosphohydrolase